MPSWEEQEERIVCHQQGGAIKIPILTPGSIVMGMCQRKRNPSFKKATVKVISVDPSFIYNKEVKKY